MNPNRQNSRHGFTLLEFMLALIIVSILLTVTIMVSFNAIARTNLRSTENTLVQMIRRTQTQSQQYADEKQWGVYIDQAKSEVETFYGDDGDDYSSNDGIDATYSFNENIIFSGDLYDLMIAAPAKGLVFKRFTGDPVEATFNGEIIMTMHGSTRNVVVNERGVVER